MNVRELIESLLAYQMDSRVYLDGHSIEILDTNFYAGNVHIEISEDVIAEYDYDLSIEKAISEAYSRGYDAGSDAANNTDN